MYYNRDISYRLSVQLVCIWYECMRMYYLYKQLERIVNVHLCNKSPLSDIVIPKWLLPR